MEANRKRAKVHMLPTNGKDIAMLSKRVKDGILQPANGTEGVANCNPMWQPQHLYFTTDEEIKEGDNVFDIIMLRIAKVVKVLEDSIRLEGEGDKIQLTFNYKKIIAATDPKLIDKCDGCKRAEGSDTIYTCSCGFSRVAQPSPAFIKAYCEQGGFDEVDVEYEPHHSGNYINDGKTHTTSVIWTLKVDLIHNTITTHLIKENL